jgi:hypothetical protein
MMNSQLSATFSSARGDHLRVLQGGRVLPLGASGGKLEVLHGRVWLTRAGDHDDYFVDLGQSIVVPASGRALVEAIDDGQPALIAWRPGTLADRIVAMLQATFGRCWEIVNPAPRIGAGALAAAIALVSGALVFGPLSEARTRELAAAGLLHNSAGPDARAGAEARPTQRGPRADARAVESRERARSAAQEARRRAAGVA